MKVGIVSENKTEVTLEKNPEKSKLPPFMVTNIILVCIVGVASILLMLFGDFDGKAIRVTSTLLVFVAFTVFAAIDSKRDKPARYMRISQLGNIYMLALSLILIWGSLGSSGLEYFEIFPSTLYLIAIIKLGIVIVQYVSNFMYHDREQLSLSSRVCAAALALSTVLYTLPIGLDSFLEFNEVYWKIAVASLLFTGMTISVSALFAWFFMKKDEAPTVKRSREQSKSGAFRANEPKAFDIAPESLESRTGRAQHRQQEAPAARPTPQTPAGLPQFAPPVAGSIPWPVFPNGTPLPATNSGRPDFMALKQFAESCAKAEQQWFSD